MKYAIAAAAMASAAVAMPQDWTPASTTANTWSEYTTTTASWSDVETSTTAAWSAYTTPSANTWSVVDTTTCYSTWTTKVCGGSGDWNNCNVETSTSTLYNDQCTWETVAATSTWAAAPVASTWAAAPVKKVCTYVTVYDKTYTTKVCGSNSGAWDNCKDVTTSSACTETVTDTSCTGTWGTWATPAAASTWSAAPVAPAKPSSWSAAPVAASSTWAPAPVAATSSVWAPVGKYTGAADKQAIGFGAAAIAAVAMML